MFIYINPIPTARKPLTCSLSCTEICLFWAVHINGIQDTPPLSKYVTSVKSRNFAMTHFSHNNHTYTSQSYYKE